MLFPLPTLVDKIIHYETSASVYGDWRLKIGYNADYSSYEAEYCFGIFDLDWSLEADGDYKYTRYVKVFDLSDLDNDNPKEMSKEEYLNIKLERAIEMEDFEEAVKLRDQIKNLGINKGMIENLELELKESIKEQNFEKSIEIRDQLRKLKS